MQAPVRPDHDDADDCRKLGSHCSFRSAANSSHSLSIRTVKLSMRLRRLTNSQPMSANGTALTIAPITLLWCARLTGEGQPVEVRRKEGVTNHFRPESCAGRCEAAGEALTGARTGRDIEHRKRERLERRDCHSGRRQHRHHRNGEGMAGSCARLTGEG